MYYLRLTSFVLHGVCHDRNGYRPRFPPPFYTNLSRIPLNFKHIGMIYRVGLKHFGKTGLEKHARGWGPEVREVMDRRLDGKVCLVTGANQGIGYQAALEFAKRGATVLVACRQVSGGCSEGARSVSFAPPSPCCQQERAAGQGGSGEARPGDGKRASEAQGLRRLLPSVSVQPSSGAAGSSSSNSPAQQTAPRSIRALVSDLESSNTPVHVLVNNAGKRADIEPCL